MRESVREGVPTTTKGRISRRDECAARESEPQETQKLLQISSTDLDTFRLKHPERLPCAFVFVDPLHFIPCQGRDV